MTGELSGLLGEDRTWTSRQSAGPLGPGVGIGHRQARLYPALLRAGYERTARTVGHRQNPEGVGRAGRVLAPAQKKLRPAG